MSLADGCVVVKKPIKFARNICLAKPKKESKKTGDVFYKVDFILAEVTNTPWGERHSYVLSASKDSKEKIKSTMKKELHVSPFWDMDHLYEWSFSSPTEKLGVYMKNFKEGEKVFDATLNLKRLILSKKSLLFTIFKFPFMTVKVVFWIHLQAFFLWLRGATFFIHPSKTNN